MIQVCDLSFANSSITDTLGNYSLVSSGTVTISGLHYPANTDPILYGTDSSYNYVEFGQTTTYSNGAIIQAGAPTYGSENWAVEFRARVTSARPDYYENYEIFYGCRAPYDNNGTTRMAGHWSISISISNSLGALEFAYVDHYDSLVIKDNLDFTSWHLYKVTKTAEEILTLHIDGVLVATINLEQQIGYKTHATLGSFALLGVVNEFPVDNRIQTNQSVRLADVKVYADPMGHAEKAISLDNLSRVFRNYNTWLGAQLSGQIGDGTLTIKVNGATAGTFTANQATAATANIQCVDLANNQTVAGNKEFTGTTTAHDLVPSATDTYNFGSSSYQWNKVYSKEYYYNGTAWGLDQANVWNTYQTIKGYYFGNEQSTNGRTCLYLTSNRDTVGQSGIYITKFRQNRAQGAMDPLGLQYVSFDVLENSIRTNGVLQLNITNWNEDGDVPSGAALLSNLSNAQLGTSNQKWKTLNGVNPGALSLPSISASGANAWIALDTTDWVKSVATSAAQKYTPPSDGWLNIRVDNATMLGLAITGGTSYMHQMVRSETPNSLALLIPVFKNTEVAILVAGNENLAYDRATFYPCQGNV